MKVQACSPNDTKLKYFSIVSPFLGGKNHAKVSQKEHRTEEGSLLLLFRKTILNLNSFTMGFISLVVLLFLILFQVPLFLYNIFSFVGLLFITLQVICTISL